MESPLKQYVTHSRNYWSALSKVQTVCRKLLKTHPLAANARTYLDGRVSSENQEKFNFGYFPNDENINILFELVPKRTLEKLGLTYPYHVQNGDLRSYIDRGIFSNHNLTLPYYDYNGNMVTLMGRTILSEIERKKQNIQKYKYLRGPHVDFSLQFKKSQHLFGLYQAKQEILKQNSVIIVEGQLDCIACHEYGIKNVVALGGISLHKLQNRLLSIFASEYKLLLDNDEEGLKAQEKIINMYSNSKIKINKFLLPKGFKDIDEFLHKSTSFDVSMLFNLENR